MNLTVKGKQIDVGDALRGHVAESLEAVVSKYFTNPQDASVVFTRNAHLFRADVTVHVGRNILVQSSAEAADAYAAADMAVGRIAKRLRRYKSRLRDHHAHVEAQQAAPLMAQQYVVPSGSDDHAAGELDAEAAAVVAEMATPIELLTVSEAVMRMDLADMPALLFRNRGHGGLNMVYRRSDGNIGWVDPQGTEGTAA